MKPFGWCCMISTYMIYLVIQSGVVFTDAPPSCEWLNMVGAYSVQPTDTYELDWFELGCESKTAAKNGETKE